MDFDVFVGSWAGVSEELTVDSCGTGVSPATPLSQDAVGPGALAVDGPLRVAVRVADGDGEAAVVGPYDVDDVPRGAVDAQRRALTRVRRPVGLTCSGCGGGRGQQECWQKQ